MSVGQRERKTKRDREWQRDRIKTNKIVERQF